MAWKRLPGTSRRYQDEETGQILSDRQYRKMRELLGQRKHFDLPRLAKQRRAQQRYNDLVKQFSQHIIETAEAQLSEAERLLEEGGIEDAGFIDEDEVYDYIEEALTMKRRAKRTTMRHADFRRAIRTLKDRTPGKEANDRRIEALKLLGRREGIPDWVPEGMSDRFRRGKLRRDRIPQYAYGRSKREQRKARR
jgi:hypothetical protein